MGLLVEFTVVGRKLVAPVGVERAADTADRTIGVAPEAFVTNARVKQLARIDESISAGIDRRDIGRVERATDTLAAERASRVVAVSSPSDAMKAERCWPRGVWRAKG